jgi:hypothetical protein
MRRFAISEPDNLVRRSVSVDTDLECVKLLGRMNVPLFLLRATLWIRITLLLKLLQSMMVG